MKHKPKNAINWKVMKRKTIEIQPLLFNHLKHKPLKRYIWEFTRTCNNKADYSIQKANNSIYKAYTVHTVLFSRYLSRGLGYIALPALLIALVAPQVLDIYQQQYVIDW